MTTSFDDFLETSVRRRRDLGSFAISSSSLRAAAPGSGSGRAARSSATSSSRTVIGTTVPGSLRTSRTNSGSRRRASLMGIFISASSWRIEQVS